MLMWISLYYANSREPGFIPCNSPDYDMALKQVCVTVLECYSGTTGPGTEILFKHKFFQVVLLRLLNLIFNFTFHGTWIIATF